MALSSSSSSSFDSSSSSSSVDSSSSSSVDSSSSSSTSGDIVNIGGLSYAKVNGSYTIDGTKDGYARYVKNSDSTIVIEYRLQFGPYSFGPAYYIIETTDIGTNADVGIGFIAPIEKPVYRNEGTDPDSGTWVDLQNW